jgi:predicted dehydrogenase
MIAGIIANAMASASGLMLQAVASRRKQTGEAFAQRHRVAEVFDDWRELVASGKVDAVYVATPTHVREAVCLAAAANGKHVLGEKPFASRESVRRITGACRDKGVAFMDATHFVHHPRTAVFKSLIRDRLGTPLVLRSAFFGPNRDAGNIRYDPAKEAMGAIGDLGWYPLRAIVECLPDRGELEYARVTAERDAPTQAVVRAAGVLRFADASTATWDVGFDANTLLMDLDVIGSDGVVKIDDFVLDWASGFRGAESEPDYRVGFSFRSGVVSPGHFEWHDTPSKKPQSALMLERFADLARDPAGAAAEQSSLITEQTQALLDSIWKEVGGMG